MRKRHQTPTFVSMWMLDVFCCALGCVTVLWLLNAREAKVTARSAAASTEQLHATQADLSEAVGMLADTDTARLALVQDKDALSKRLSLVTNERDAHAAALVRLRTDIEQLNTAKALVAQQLVTAQKQSVDLTAALQAATQEQDRLSKKAQEQQAALMKIAADNKENVAILLRTQEKLQSELNARQADLKKLNDESMKSAATRGTAETRVKELEKDLASAKQTVADLLGDKRVLADQMERIRAAADNRFAGINLTGKRVLFLIDMSGSMKYIDETTPEVTKWAGVRATVAKVIKSLPDMEKCQVILFSTDARYLMGSPDQWLDVSSKTADQVEAALGKIDPTGNTNMSVALETAFRFRDKGLDTIYVFSDGLPNVGAGLTAADVERIRANVRGLTSAEADRVAETQRCDILAKFIRKKLRTDWNLVRASSPRVRINTIGFFYESPDVGAFLWALARENDGSFVGMSRP